MFAFLADAADHSDGGTSFPALDLWHYPSQIVWLTLTFGTLYWVLSSMILPRMSANLERRSDTIANDLDEAARLNENAQEAKQALEVSLAKARAGASQTVQEAEAKMADEIATETRRLDSELESKLAAAEASIAEVRAEALSNVETVAGDATGAILKKLGLSSVSSKDIGSAVKTAIERA